MKIPAEHVKISAIVGRTTPVSGVLALPADAKAVLVLAHGAGAGMNHSFMKDLVKGLAAEGLGSLRFQFPYMEDGGKRPDQPKLATATVAAAVQWVEDQRFKLPIFAAGKSFGSRMATMAAAQGMLPAIQGIVCFGFPLHPAKKPSIERAKHLRDVRVPLLFLQGTRDALADLSLMTPIARDLPLATLHIVEGADHSFAVLKSSGRNAEQVLGELARETRAFCEKQRP